MGLQLSGALWTVAGMGYDRPHAGNRDYVKCSLFFLKKSVFFENIIRSHSVDCSCLVDLESWGYIVTIDGASKLIYII